MNANRHKSARVLALLGAMGALAALNGCAVWNRDNTPTFNWVEERLVPEDEEKQRTALPLLLPPCLAAIAVDAALVHPVSVIDDCYRDTMKSLWADYSLRKSITDPWRRAKWDTEYMTECAKLPWRAAATPANAALQFGSRTVFSPIQFGFRWAGRSLFDIPEKAREVKKERQDREALDQASALIEQGKASEAYDLLAKQRWIEDKDMRWEAEFLSFKAAAESGRVDEFVSRRGWRELMESPYAVEAEPYLEKMRKSENPAVRWQAAEADFARANAENKSTEPVLLRLLADPNPIIRSRVLGQRNAQHYILNPDDGSRTPFPNLRQAIERVAKEDPDPMNRADAARAIKTHAGR